MNLSIKPITESELINLYELYRLANEPDSPKEPFHSLDINGKQDAIKRFEIQNHYSIYKDKTCIGFVGIYSDTTYANLLYIFYENQRGKGYLTPVLNLIKNFCLKTYREVKVLVAVTRPENIASIKGLEKAGFINDGEVIDSGTIYLEYSFELN